MYCKDCEGDFGNLTDHCQVCGKDLSVKEVQPRQYGVEQREYVVYWRKQGSRSTQFITLHKRVN